MFAEIPHFRAVIGRLVEFGVRGGFVGYGDVEPAAKFDEFVFVEFFLLVRDVSALARFAKAVALDGVCKDYGGRSRGARLPLYKRRRLWPGRARRG